MPRGTLEVLLVKAKGLQDTDFLSRMDPYCILTCRTQEKKSSVASGSSPEWNQTFVFFVSSDAAQLRIKIMDKDTFSADDFIGEITISLKTVFQEKNIPPMSYNVVKDERYCGEIKLGLKFTPVECTDREFGEGMEDLGGWEESSLDDHF